MERNSVVGLLTGHHWITIPPVLRGFFEVIFCSMEMVGERPSMESTSG
jgi:hypothetical protein